LKVFQQITDYIRDVYRTPEGFIPLHAPVFKGNEKQYLEQCIDSNFVSSVGAFVDLFEVKMAEYTGAKKAVACVNGTNALHLALLLSGVEAESEVLTQALTFIATANAISYCGAHPVFLDVDMDTLSLSPVSIRKWLANNAVFEKGSNKPVNKNTGRIISACVPMHTFGHPAKIDEIVAVCNEYNIPVVEDAAESLGSFYKDKHTGTYGEIGILSFNGNKVITTGGGGMMLFNDEQLAEKAKHLTTQAKVPHEWEFIHDMTGYNYRMPNINAALGLAQLEQLPAILESKRMIAEKYRNFFNTLGVEFVIEPVNAKSNYWLNCILLKNKNERDAFLNFTNEQEVMTRPVWRLMNELDMFKRCETDNLQNAGYIAERLVNLPSSVIV
jgi:aminotransferase in exopolysaccharide biosynthesis